tara:strand:- start:1982 stop:2776 length:795 start_codon:yes stop_codon:yes gene_type:complete
VKTNTKKSFIESLTLISVCFNQFDYLDDFFNSFLEVYGEIPCQILIADNASQDGSYQKLMYWKNTLGDNVKIIKNTQNIGFAKANNQLVKTCQSDLLGLLNLDIKFNTDFINPCAKACKFHQALIAPKLCDLEYGHYRHYAPFPDDPMILVKEFGYLFLQYFEAVPVDWLQGACWFVPRKIFEEIEGFDEKYFIYTEDLEFCRNLKDKNISRILMNSQTIYHPRTRSSEEKQKIIDQNLVYYFRNRDQSPWLVRNFLRQLFSIR